MQFSAGEKDPSASTRPHECFSVLIEFDIYLRCTGSIEEQEYYTDILLGIKQVIQCHLKDLQGRFQDKFINLEMEVRRRDDIIVQLQNRLREFEPGDRMTPITERDMSGSTNSSNELPFMVSVAHGSYSSSIDLLILSISIAGRLFGHHFRIIATLRVRNAKAPKDEEEIRRAARQQPVVGREQ